MIRGKNFPPIAQIDMSSHGCVRHWHVRLLGRTPVVYLPCGVRQDYGHVLGMPDVQQVLGECSVICPANRLRQSMRSFLTGMLGYAMYVP